MRIDDRTDEQRKTHHVLVTATDKALSGWGNAKNGVSRCAWACEPKDYEKVLKWVENRSDMKYVDVKYDGKWHPKNTAHLQIYVVTDGHRALR